jgi:thioredoxin 2
MSATVSPESVHATCPGCGKTIRIPSARLEDNPSCPGCQSRIFSGAPIVLDDRSFDQFIARNDLPIIIDFWAPWCGPCRSFAPVIEEAARRLSSHVLVAKVNSDEAPAAAQRFQIRSIPTVALLRNGQEIARKTGALPLAALLQWMTSLGIRVPSGT